MIENISPDCNDQILNDEKRFCGCQSTRPVYPGSDDGAEDDDRDAGGEAVDGDKSEVFGRQQVHENSGTERPQTVAPRGHCPRNVNLLKQMKSFLVIRLAWEQKYQFFDSFSTVDTLHP